MKKIPKLHLLLAKINATNAPGSQHPDIINLTSELSYSLRGGLKREGEDDLPNPSCSNSGCYNQSCNMNSNPTNQTCNNESCTLNLMTNGNCQNNGCN